MVTTYMMTLRFELHKFPKNTLVTIKENSTGCTLYKGERGKIVVPDKALNKKVKYYFNDGNYIGIMIE